MSKDQIERLLTSSKNDFLIKDYDLLDVDANERSLTHKFAEYLQKHLRDEYSVDCEYNRSGSDLKKIMVIRDIVGDHVSTSSIDARTVYPDIIVHRRGTAGPNILIIEAKKNPTANDENKDVDKIRKMKSCFGYQYGIFLKFDTNNEDISWLFV